MGTPPTARGAVDALKRFLTAASLVLFAASCTSDVVIEDALPPSASASASATSQPVTDYASFKGALDAAGVEVQTDGGQGLKRLLGVPGHHLTVGAGSMYAHEYPTGQALLAFQLSVDPSGGTIPTSDGNGTILVEWDPPRFYRSGKLLVVYFGHDRLTLQTLNRLLGSPFAGGGQRGGSEIP